MVFRVKARPRLPLLWLVIGAGYANVGAPSMVSMHQDAPLAHYAVIEFAPVVNDGMAGSPDAAAMLKQDITADFTRLGYTVA